MFNNFKGPFSLSLGSTAISSELSLNSGYNPVSQGASFSYIADAFKRNDDFASESVGMNDVDSAPNNIAALPASITGETRTFVVTHTAILFTEYTSDVDRSKIAQAINDISQDQRESLIPYLKNNANNIFTEWMSAEVRTEIIVILARTRGQVRAFVADNAINLFRKNRSIFMGGLNIVDDFIDSDGRLKIIRALDSVSEQQWTFITNYVPGIFTQQMSDNDRAHIITVLNSVPERQWSSVANHVPNIFTAQMSSRDRAHITKFLVSTKPVLGNPNSNPATLAFPTINVEPAMIPVERPVEPILYVYKQGLSRMEIDPIHSEFKRKRPRPNSTSNKLEPILE